MTGRRVTLPVIATTLVCVLVVGVHRVWTRTRPLRSPIVVQGANFGAAFATSSYAHSLRIHNVSADPIILESVQSSCDCATVGHPDGGWAAHPINPGESIDLDLRLDLTRNLELKSSPSFTPVAFSSQIIPTFRLNASRHSEPLTISGRLTLPVVANRLSVDFGEMGASPDPQIVVLTRHSEAHDLTVRVDGAGIAATLSNCPTDSSMYELTLAPQVDKLPDVVSATVHIDCRRGDRQLVSCLTIRVVGRNVGDVYLAQRSLVLGTIAIGTAVESRVRVCSRDSMPFSIVSARARSPELELEALATDSKDPHVDYLLRVKPTAIGSMRHPFEIEIVTAAGLSRSLAGVVHYKAVRSQ